MRNRIEQEEGVPVIRYKRCFNPHEDRGHCSACHKMPEANAALDGVMAQANGEGTLFYFLCLDCARKIGKAAR